MDYRKIISESWHYTQNNKQLIRWFGFFPAIFTTTFSTGYLTYQFFALKNSYIFSPEHEESFFFQVASMIFGFIKAHISWTVPLVTVGAIYALFYFLLPTLTKASAIQMIARNRNGQTAGLGTGLKHGFMSFLKLFEYHLLIKTFAFFSILTEMSFVARNLGLSLFETFLPIFILLMAVSVLLTLLFTYADWYIVIDDDGVFDAMKKSAKMVMMNLKHTFLITILMLLIGLRIIIQVVMVLLIPFLIILITGYLATVTLPITGIIVGAAVGLLGIIIASYLNGVVDIFSYSVWTFTFLELTNEKELSARDVRDVVEESEGAAVKENLDGIMTPNSGAHKNLE